MSPSDVAAAEAKLLMHITSQCEQIQHLQSEVEQQRRWLREKDDTINELRESLATAEGRISGLQDRLGRAARGT